MPKTNRVLPTRAGSGRDQRTGRVAGTTGARGGTRGRSSRSVEQPREEVDVTAHSRRGTRGRGIRGHGASVRSHSGGPNKGANGRPGKRARSNSTTSRPSKRSAHSTGPAPSFTEADIPRIADAVIQAMSTRSRESPHSDSESDLTDTENVTDEFTPVDTAESGKIYYNQ